MKNGIEYFPLEVYLDEKFELIEAEFGLTGFGVVVKLLQKIYGGQGYYIEWTNEVALLFAKRIGLGGSAVSEIVTAAIRRGIFDKTLYEKYGILTSSGIQKRYFEIVSRRKNVEVKKEYLLFCDDKFFKNVNILTENVNINAKNADISEQSKVKESKVNNNPPIARAREEEFLTAFDAFVEEFDILVDTCDSRVGDLDYVKLRDIYSRSSKCLNGKYGKWMRTLSWVAKNYAKIINGNYVDDMQKRKNDETMDILERLYNKYEEESNAKVNKTGCS